jgi:hypothetical protein
VYIAVTSSNPAARDRWRQPQASTLTLQASHLTGPMKTRVVAAAATVRRGRPLAEALAPMGLSPEDVALIRMGEDSGRLGELLHELAAELEADRQFLGELLGGLVYPVFLLFLNRCPAGRCSMAGVIAAALPGWWSRAYRRQACRARAHPVGRRLRSSCRWSAASCASCGCAFAVSLALASHAGIAPPPPLIQRCRQRQAGETGGHPGLPRRR